MLSLSALQKNAEMSIHESTAGAVSKQGAARPYTGRISRSQPIFFPARPLQTVLGAKRLPETSRCARRDRAVPSGAQRQAKPKPVSLVPCSAHRRDAPDKPPFTCKQNAPPEHGNCTCAAWESAILNKPTRPKRGNEKTHHPQTPMSCHVPKSNV